MAIKRKTEQVLTYLELGEREELDAAVDELEMSRAAFVRACILEVLEKRRQGLELLEASGDFVVVGEVPALSSRIDGNSLG